MYICYHRLIGSSDDMSGLQLALGYRQCNVKLGSKEIGRLALVRTLPQACKIAEWGQQCGAEW